jgi:hypothetical protein
MLTLLDEKFAPITSSIGFIELPIDAVAAELNSWRMRLYEEVEVTHLSSGFPDALRQLEPLVGGDRPREILVSMGSDWTAYFDCLLGGTDASSAVGYLTRALDCRGLAVKSVPPMGTGGVPSSSGRQGAVQFTVMGPDNDGSWLNHLRAIEAVQDGKRWEFGLSGQPQPFEESSAYMNRRLRDRFTPEMLERYCLAVGVDVFNESAYGDECTLFRSSTDRRRKQVVLPATSAGSHVSLSSGPATRLLTLTLSEAQERLGIVPGAAAAVPW